jgi:Protein of unknown function (DUF3558)
MRFKPIVVAVIALAALAGCKDNSSPTTGTAAQPANAGAAAGGAANAGGGGAVDPCSLITTSEATAVLGKAAKDGAPHSYQNTKQCQWDVASGASYDGSIAILVYIGGQKTQWPSTVSLAKKSPKYSDVQGLGDAAFSNGFDLHILKGDDMYQIGVSGPFQNLLDKATTVARQALARA